jgi:hypothetical protein
MAPGTGSAGACPRWWEHSPILEGKVEKELSKALLDFYHKILQPDLVDIKQKLQGQDKKFVEMLGHFDGVHKRLDDLEESIIP